MRVHARFRASRGCRGTGKGDVGSVEPRQEQRNEDHERRSASNLVAKSPPPGVEAISGRRPLVVSSPADWRPGRGIRSRAGIPGEPRTAARAFLCPRGHVVTALCARHVSRPSSLAGATLRPPHRALPPVGAPLPPPPPPGAAGPPPPPPHRLPVKDDSAALTKSPQ